MKIQMRVLATIVLIAFSGACAKKKQMQNNVAPETYHKKADISANQYHMVRAIEEADSKNDFEASPGYQLDFGVVKPVITEKLLQFVKIDLDGDGRPETPDVVAAFAITKQFDIVDETNDYGEKTGKIVEEEKRPWTERQYIRVDWSQQSIEAAKVTNQLFAIGSTLSESNVVLLGDPKIDKDGSIIVTTQSIIEEKGAPGEDNFDELFSGPQSVKMRTTLFPDKANDFKKRFYPNEDFARYGLFRTAENFPDPEKGPLDSTQDYRANLFNVCEAGNPGSCSTNKIVYYLSDGFPDMYRDGARSVIAEWNRVFKSALNRSDDVVVLDESQTYPISDPRVSMIAYYPSPTKNGLLGVAQFVNNQKTGETISARATIYGDGINYTIGNVGDIFDLYIATEGQIPGCGAAPAGLKLDVLDRPLSVAEQHSAKVQVASNKVKAGVANRAAQDFDLKALMKTTVDNVKRGGNSATKFAKLLQDKRELVTPSFITKLVSIDTSGSVQKDFDDSFVNGVSGLKASTKLKELKLAALGTHDATYVEDAAIHYMETFARRNQGLCSNPDALREALKKDVAQKTFTTTLLHEMGHDFGLRHNFHASADREDLYHPKYAELKAKLAAGDPSVTKDDLTYYAYTSVMDYDSAFFEVAGGLGPYDLAAIRYAYNRSIGKDDSITSKPYQFCTDHQLGEDLLCRQFDRGNTVNQQVQFLSERYNRNYVLNHLRRGRANFNGEPSQVIRSMVRNTMLPIRQTLDEFIYQLVVSPNAADNDFGCDSEFMRKSVAAGEIVNICDAVEAQLAGVDMLNLDTLVNGLYKPAMVKDPNTGKQVQKMVLRKDPKTYIPNGLADLVLSNSLARTFFTRVIGAPEPGIYLVEPDDNQNPILTRLADNLSSDDKTLSPDQLRLIMLAQDRGVDDVEGFVKANLPNITEIKLGPVGKLFGTEIDNTAGFPQLKTMGFEADKQIALRVMRITNYGIRKYEQESLAGNIYLWPQGRRWATNIIDSLATDGSILATVPVTTRAGTTYLAGAPNSTNSDMRIGAIVTALAGFTSDLDRSFANKLRVCDSNDHRCDGGDGLDTVTVSNAAGAGTYKAAQLPGGDSVSFDLLTAMKTVSDQRAGAMKTKNTAAAVIKSATDRMAANEQVRADFETALLATDSFKPIVPLLTGLDQAKVDALIKQGVGAVVGALLASPAQISMWERTLLVAGTVNDLPFRVVLAQKQPMQEAIGTLGTAIGANKDLDKAAKDALVAKFKAFVGVMLTLKSDDPKATPDKGALDILSDVATAGPLIQLTTERLNSKEGTISTLREIMKDLSLD